MEFFAYFRDQQVHYALIPGSAAIGTTSSFNQSFTVTASDTLDFMVGPGPSRDEYADASQVDVTITFTP